MHARSVVLIANMSIGVHRLSLFVPEPTSQSVTLRYDGMEHYHSGLMNRVEDVYSTEPRAAIESVQSGSPSSVTTPLCSLAVSSQKDEGVRVSSFTCMTRILRMAIRESRCRGTQHILDSVNHGKYISVRSDYGPVVNVTHNGVMLYMGSSSRYSIVMSTLLGLVSDLFTSKGGPSVAAQLRRVVKYRWVLRLSETT